MNLKNNIKKGVLTPPSKNSYRATVAILAALYFIVITPIYLFDYDNLKITGLFLYYVSVTSLFVIILQYFIGAMWQRIELLGR